MTAALHAAQNPSEDSGHLSAYREVSENIRRSEEDEDLRKSEVRRPIYQDVEDLLARGFLSHPITVAGVSLAFRTLSPGDLFLLRHRVAKATVRQWRLWTVASSIWMVEGNNLLLEPHTVPAVYHSLERLPSSTLDILYSISTGLFNRLCTALKRIEPYCYEPYSRVMWRFCGRSSPARDAFTGIPGSERLGMNHVQQVWTAFNLAEDDRLNHLQGWHAAKLIASASNPKGIRKLNATDENLQKQEDRRRKEAVHKMLLEIWTGSQEEEPDEIVVMVRGQPVTVPRPKMAHSAEELEDEMQRWVSGEKDWHDLVVDAYKERLRTQFESEQQERKQVLAEVQPSLAAYTPEQIRELRPDLFTNSVRMVYDNEAPQALYQRYVARDPRTPSTPRDLEQDLGGRGRPMLSTEPMPRSKR